MCIFQITLETFLAWKKKKIKERDAAQRKASDQKKKDYKSGKESGLSGKYLIVLVFVSKNFVIHFRLFKKPLGFINCN